MLRHQDVTAHRMVADLAVAMAEEVYEQLASNNAFYAQHKDRTDFIKECAPTLREEARSILAGMLADPSISEMQKEEIYEAICMDHALPKGGTSIVKKGSF